MARTQGLLEWSKSLDLDRSALLAEEIVAPTAAGNLQIAEMRSRNMFPPDRRGAIRAVYQALMLDPLEASSWMVLAREHLLLNEIEEARAALARSDELDPRYPGQRVEAIRLWAYLDEPARALELAQQLALLGEEYAAVAAAELVATGADPAFVFEALRVEEMPAADLLATLKAMAEATPQAVAPLYETIPGEHLRDRDFANQFIRLQMNPMNESQIERVWGLHGTALSRQAGLLVDNPQLLRPPFDANFYLGWQRPLQTTTVTSRWRAADTEIRGTGAQVEIHFNPAARDVIRWTFYRLPLPAGWNGEVALRVRVDPPSRGACRLWVQRDGEPLISPFTGAAEAGWQWLTVPITASNRSQVAELIFERQARGRPSRTDVLRVDIDQLRIRSDKESEESIPKDLLEEVPH